MKDSLALIFRPNSRGKETLSTILPIRMRENQRTLGVRANILCLNHSLDMVNFVHLVFLF